MRRREFLGVLGSAAAAWPLTVRAQQPAMPVVGYLGIETPELYASRLRAFREGLGSTGYEEGRNVVIDYRWAEGHNDRLPALAADLVRHQLAVIATPGGSPGALAAKAATSTIPIVFEMGADPVASGLVASLNKPGGNITGATSLSGEVNPKRLELLHEVVPEATLFGLLVNPTNPANAQPSIKLVKAVADSLGVATPNSRRKHGTRFRRRLCHAGEATRWGHVHQQRYVLRDARKTTRSGVSSIRHSRGCAISRIRRGWRPDGLTGHPCGNAPAR